ncbi:MAG: NAD(P)-dependent oxidoreductase [Myxococcota bacterium]
MKTVLVTGARGTVGNYVVSLAEASGYRVIASDIDPRGVRAPVHGEVRAADLTEEAQVASVVRGVDVVVHTAGLIDVSAGAGELSRVNSEAVTLLYEAAAEAGAQRFVHLSVGTLYDAKAAGGGPLAESAPLAPRGPYALSKLGAELYLRGRAAGEGPTWTILRAAPLYGRRGRHFAGTLLAIGPMLGMTSPVIPRPSGGPIGSMVHAEDVARAMLFVIEREDTAGRVLNVSDGDDMELGRRLGLTFDAYGLRSVPTGTVPDRLFRIGSRLLRRNNVSRSFDVAALAGWRAVVLRHGLKPALKPRFDEEVLELVHQPLQLDSSALRSLGWSPRHASFEAGWREVLRWYQAERWVPRYG